MCGAAPAAARWVVERSDEYFCTGGAYHRAYSTVSKQAAAFRSIVPYVLVFKLPPVLPFCFLNPVYNTVVKKLTWPPCCKISNGHISAIGHPIHFVFGSGVGFSRLADPMAPLLVGPNPRWRPISNGHIYIKTLLENYMQRVIRSTSCLVLG